MKLTYLQLPNKKKLIPLHRHDYQDAEIDGIYYFIDGDSFTYIRSSHSELLKQATVLKLIPVIRERFTWTSIYNKDMSLKLRPEIKLVKDLESDHILAIIDYLHQRNAKIKNKENMSDALQLNKLYIVIFKAELKYRYGKATS